MQLAARGRTARSADFSQPKLLNIGHELGGISLDQLQSIPIRAPEAGLTRHFGRSLADVMECGRPAQHFLLSDCSNNLNALKLT
jgi:hypothetical protein